MYAGVVVVQIHPGKEDEAIRLYRDEQVPVLQQQPGYRGGHLLLNRETRQAISVGFWDTEEQSRAFEASSVFTAAISRFTDLIVGSPVRDMYEVAVNV